MKIDWRQRLTIAQHQPDARNGRSQRLKRRLHAEDHFGAARGHQRRVAHKVNGIPEPLLGKQQNGLVLDRFGAEPQRRHRALPPPRADEFLPAPLILVPAAPEGASRKCTRL